MKTCQHCGKEVGAETINGLCPECLMKVGLGSEVGPSGTDETKPSENTFAPPPNAPLSIEEVRKLFPQLEIIEQIGRGGMGVVYKARQPQLDRIVALKLLPTEIAKTPGFAERFAREARALARLSHPNIVAVHDSGNADGHFYFIMEFVDGANLRQMIAAKQIAPEAALTIVPKVCEALQFAHDEGILHRDIKPENILIDKKGRVKIADFGLAKLIGDDTVDHSLTGTQQIMGTPRYMAPEQFENTKTVDHRADIYSLGVVFYEMLTGEIPMGRFALPSQKVQVDVRIDEVVLRSLEREPAQRYQHVSEVKTGVENVTHHAVKSDAGIPARAAERKAVAVETVAVAPHTTFLRSMLWLVVVIGAVMFCWFEKVTYAGSNGYTLLRIGAVTPWLIVGRDTPNGNYVTPNFATVSAFAALCAIVAGFALFSTRRSKSGIPTAGNSGVANFQSLESRLSPQALWGALLTIPGLAVWIMLMRGLVIGTSNEGAWMAGGGKWETGQVADLPGGAVLFAIMAVFGLGCLFASASLGRSATTQIKGSAGKLRGLPLAAYASAFFPVLVIGTGALFLAHIIQIAFWTKTHTSYSYVADKLTNVVAPNPAHRPISTFILVDVLAVATVMFFAARFAWRKIAGVVPATGTSGGANFQTLEKPKRGMSVAKVVAIVIGVIALVASVPFVLFFNRGNGPAAYGAKADSVRAVITEDASANEGAASGVHRMFRYTASAPVDHRATFWVEYWRDGKLDKKAGLTGGQMIQFPSRAAFEGGFDFSLADGTKTSPDAAGKVRWDFFVSSRLRDWVSSNGVMKVNNDAGRGGHGNWIADPFAGLDVVSSWGKKPLWEVATGESVTVLVLRGYATGENLAVGLNAEEAKQGKATILVRARFDAVPPGERVEHSRTVSLNAGDVEKLGVPAPKPVAVGKPAVIREDASGVATNKLFRDFRYHVNASANQRATFWVELWRDGELQRAAGTTAGLCYEPARGIAFDALFIFSVFDAAQWGKGAEGQLMWNFTAESMWFDGHHATHGLKLAPGRLDALREHRKWIGNPFEDLEVRTSWSGKRSWPTTGGETVTLLMLTGDPAGKAPDAVTDEAMAKRSKSCLLLKVRFDDVLAEELKDGASAMHYLSADDIDPLGKPAAVPTTDPRFVIAQDRSKVSVEKTAGREEFAFTLSGPTGFTLKVWAELWQEGRMTILGGLDYHIVPKGGQRIETPFALATTDGDVASVESKGMMRLDWGLDGAWNNNQWRTNIFKGMGAVHRSWDHEPRKWNPRPGEAVTIMSITGYKISEFRSAMSVFTEADLIKGWPNAAIIVRAQFTPAKPGEIRDGEGPSVSNNGMLNLIGSGRLPFAQFEIAKQLGVDVSRCQMPAEAHALLVAAASTKEGQESAVKMLGEFLSNVSYVTTKNLVIEPMDTLWWRARKGQTVNAEELVTVLERFIEDLNTGIRLVSWNRPEPIIKGENGPQLSDATAKLLKLTKPQHEEANKIFQKYAQEARVLERRHTQIRRQDEGRHVLVTISHYSTQCLAIASNMVAELGGIVPQNILPAIRPGGLPAVVFGSAGECRTEIELRKADGKYHLNVRTLDWLPAPGMYRSDSSFSNSGPKLESTFYGDYRLYWTEE